MAHAVIMAGGGGTRFWPRSRARRPKQFLTLTGDRSLLQLAQDRLEGQVGAGQTWILTSEQYAGTVSRQLPNVPAEQIIGEPVGRDTAPCIGLGAALIAREDPEAVMIVTPADHIIEPEREFHRAVQVGIQMVEEHPDALVTCGIVPTFPSTGYGYIHRGKQLVVRQGVEVFRVAAYKEKPTFEVAESYCASGEYYWNSGIFIWKVAKILDELRQHQPEIYTAVQRIAEAWNTPKREEVFQSEYDALTKISIDLAVMEKAKEVLVVHAPFRWDDVGSWLALERMHPQDADHNTILAKHVGLQTERCIIVGEKQTLITTLGVSDLLIIQDGNAILVASKKEEGTVKQLVELLRQRGLEEYL